MTTIARASTITSAAEVPLGNNCYIRWTPKSKDFRYKIKFALGSFSYTTGAIHPNTTSTYNYTEYAIPLTVASQLPNATSGTMTATLYTYSDSGATVQVGSASSATFTVSVPDNASTKPYITMTLSPVTPYAKFASIYLQGRSSVKASFTGSGQYGANIKSYSMKIGTKSYSDPYTSDILVTSGNITVTGIATDSRGYSTTITQTINVFAYETPYISPYTGYKNIICERSTSDGTASDSGTYLHLKGKRNYSKINTGGIVNTCNVKCRYKSEGGAWSHESGAGVNVLINTNTSTDLFDISLPNIVSDTTRSYTVELNITDGTNLYSAVQFNIPSETIALHFKEGGKGAAFGKYSYTDNMLECAWNAKFNASLAIHGEDVADFVVEEGKIGNWYCRKWYSGRADCWYNRTNAYVNVNTALGTGLYYGTVHSTDYPFTFVEKPMCQITCVSESIEDSLILSTCGSGTTALSPIVMVCRPDTKVIYCTLSYYVHGRWK